MVVCAAAHHFERGITICGPRHGDCINLISQLGIDEDPGYDVWELGFVDQDNEFMTRDTAWRLADARGQIRRPCGHETDFNSARTPGKGDSAPLFSENLY